MALSISKASEANKSATTIFRLWNMLQPIRLNFLEQYETCRVLTENIEETEADDLMVLYSIEAFEIPPGIEAVVLDLKHDLELKHGWGFPIGSTEANNSQLTANERVTRKKEETQKEKAEESQEEDEETKEKKETGARKKVIKPHSIVSSLEDESTIRKTGNLTKAPTLDPEKQELLNQQKLQDQDP